MSASKTTITSFKSQTIIKKQRDSPTPSILKSPTPTFDSSKRYSVRTRRLKFANGPDVSNLMSEAREGSFDSVSTSSTADISVEDRRFSAERSVAGSDDVEVVLSPNKKMKVSREAWDAFVEYQKYDDYSSETEKTDFTYSRLSKFRDKEIIPGFRVRPNLSRRPIRSYGSYSSESSVGAATSMSAAGHDAKHEGRLSFQGSLSGGGGDFWRSHTEWESYMNNQNERSESSPRSGYHSDENLNYDSTSYNYRRFGDDLSLIQGKKGFAHSSFRTDAKSPRFARSWDVDETDNFISSTYNEKSSSTASSSWPSSSPYSVGRRIVGGARGALASLVYGIASVLAFFKDLFSRYVLRREVHPYNYSYQYKARPSWSQRSAYSYDPYRSSERSKWSEWWYSSFLYAFYEKLMSTASASREYIRGKYERSSRKGKLIWFLVPILVLLGLWLSRSEGGEDAYVANQITALKCKANQLYSPARSHVNSAWRTLSGASEKVFGESLKPLGYLTEYLGWVLGIAGDGLLALAATLLRVALSAFAFLRDAIASAFELLAWLFVTSPVARKSEEAERTVAVSRVSRDVSDPSAEIGEHWNMLKRRIEDLEEELRRKSIGNEETRKELEEKYRAFQKYRVIVNEALRRQSVKPTHVTKSSIQYYLDTHSEELKKWILAHFMSKSDSTAVDESKVAAAVAKLGNPSREELTSLQAEFSRFAKEYGAELAALKTDIGHVQYREIAGADAAASVPLIKRIVADEIKLHDADKTGKVDYALGSAGGRVLSIKCTENYDYCHEYGYQFGLYLKCTNSRDNSPDAAISPGMAPGQCWAFVGSQGFLVVQLSHAIVVSGFTVEHVSRLLSPSGKIESAPRRFSMWGLKAISDPEPHLFGEYEYRDNDETYQYFPVANATPESYRIVEMSILSNHGNPNYTCLYRIRVHGDALHPSHA